MGLETTAVVLIGSDVVLPVAEEQTCATVPMPMAPSTEALARVSKVVTRTVASPGVKALRGERSLESSLEVTLALDVCRSVERILGATRGSLVLLFGLTQQ